MTGLFVLALAFVWLTATILLSRWIGRRFTNSTAQTITALAAFTVLLPLPVVDELIGMQQFGALCREGAVLKLDAKRIKGRAIRLVINPSNEILQNTALRIYHTRISYRDALTNQELASFSSYVVKGGWLIKFLGIFDSGVPLLIAKPWCGPANEGLLPTLFDFTLTH